MKISINRKRDVVAPIKHKVIKGIDFGKVERSPRWIRSFENSRKGKRKILDEKVISLNRYKMIEYHSNHRSTSTTCHYGINGSTFYIIYDSSSVEGETTPRSTISVTFQLGQINVDA